MAYRIRRSREPIDFRPPHDYTSAMQQGRGGMGSRKHGKSGHASQSPRFRLWARLEAERAPEKKQPRAKFRNSIREVFDRQKPR
jgi:hypothetical protein